MKAHNSKGISVIMGPFLVLLLVVGGLVIFGLTWPFGKGVESQADIQLDLYARAYGLEAAKSFLSVSLRYSVYQASFESLKRAGRGSSSPDGRFLLDGKKYYTLPTKEAFLAELSSSVKGNLRSYTSAPYLYEKYSVSFPSVKDIGFSETSDQFIVRPEFDGFLKIDDAMFINSKKLADVRMEEAPSAEEAFAFNLITIHDIASGAASKIKSEAIEIVNAGIATLPKSANVQAAEGEPTCEGLFEAQSGKKIGDAAKAVEDSLAEITYSPEANSLGTDYSFKIALVSARLTITPEVVSKLANKETGKTDLSCKYTYEPLLVFSSQVTYEKSGFPVSETGKVADRKIAMDFAIKVDKDDFSVA